MSEPKFADTLEPFFTALHRYPLLTAAEEQTLGRQVQTMQAILSGNLIIDDELEKKRLIAIGRRAKEKMINHNLRLVVKIAKRHQYQGVEFPDLIQEGVIGLNRGIELFDPDKGFKLSTYITWWIRQAITRSIARDSRAVRLPIHVNEKLIKVKKVGHELRAELGRFPTTAELSETTGITEDALLELNRCKRRAVSLNAKVGFDQEDEMLGLLTVAQTNNAVSPDVYIEMVEAQERIDEAFQSLPDNQQAVLKAAFGLDGKKSRTYKEIGAQMGISHQRANQLKKSAFWRLRTGCMREKLQCLIN